MMALSMVVICALIGADGLGREVLFALRRLRVGMAMEAGLAIVSMAILLDRLELRLEPGRAAETEAFPSTCRAAESVVTPVPAEAIRGRFANGCCAAVHLSAAMPI